MNTTKTTNPASTYDRDQVPADKTGQCPCCLKQFRSSTRGTLVRHGWKETGRVVGQIGCGFQFGNCLGSGSLPLEQTDRDAQRILVQLAATIVRAKAAIETETAGRDAYGWTLQVENRESGRHAGEVQNYENALRFLGVEFKSVTGTESRRAFRVYTVNVTNLITSIKRGEAERTAKVSPTDWREVRVPAYETLRVREERAARDLLTSLEAQETAIRAAVQHHLENPSNGGVDAKKRGPITHALHVWVRSETSCVAGATLEQRTVRAIECGARGYSPRASANAVDVTCSKCLKATAKRLERAAQKAGK